MDTEDGVGYRLVVISYPQASQLLSRFFVEVESRKTTWGFNLIQSSVSGLVSD